MARSSRYERINLIMHWLSSWWIYQVSSHKPKYQHVFLRQSELICNQWRRLMWPLEPFNTSSSPPAASSIIINRKTKTDINKIFAFMTRWKGFSLRLVNHSNNIPQKNMKQNMKNCVMHLIFKHKGLQRVGVGRATPHTKISNSQRVVHSSRKKRIEGKYMKDTSKTLEVKEILSPLAWKMGDSRSSRRTVGNVVRLSAETSPLERKRW